MAGAFSPGHREVHMNEISDSERLTLLSLAVADALFMLDNEPSEATVRNAWMDLNEAYRKWGRQD